MISAIGRLGSATLAKQRSSSSCNKATYKLVSNFTRKNNYNKTNRFSLQRRVFTNKSSNTTGTKKKGIIKRYPFITQLVFVTIKTAGTDLGIQVTVEKKKWYEIDWNRNLVFTLFGAVYLGGVQYAMYVEGFKRLFPAMERFCNLSFRAKLKDREGIKSLLQQIGLDFVIIQPLLYWPAFYLCKEYVIQITENIEETGNNLFIRAMNRYKETAIEDNFGMCGFWFPIDLIIYSVPIHLRLPLNHGASLAWTGIVSIFRGATEDENGDDRDMYNK